MSTKPDWTLTNKPEPKPEPEPVFRVTPVGFPGPPAVDLSAFPADAVRAFDGPPPPYALSFSGKDCVEYDLSGIDWDWMSRSYSAVLVARLEVGDRPCRLMGNLDTRSGDRPKPGWAILLVPTGPDGLPLETVTGVSNSSPRDAAASDVKPAQPGDGERAAQARLAFCYATQDGQVERVLGRPFRPGGRWWRITFSKAWRVDQVTIQLGEAPYLECDPDEMLQMKCHPRFWLGCPDFADEQFHGQIGGFALQRADPSTGPGLDLGRDTHILSGFSYSPDGQVLDFSGRGRHGKMIGCEWTRVTERALPSESRQEPSPGKRFALVLGQGRIVELLGTRERVH